ncbi:SdpA family antimicrobial peptide system protein [Flavobacterium sp. HJJ]|uniref:SdpA family antimicrobial peptide system protein n=1 Tax=Flavobacterium sp. HJJ TaxID=2783792 RepID=UPI00188D5A55|nr:SdpA family antimicrobial peptide system protein [Flavobacterium sp. HJJ]MBF4472904.1 SdpA family antimicrobial peptide system protein [Flavobacterium sp. HJJ]
MNKASKLSILSFYSSIFLVLIIFFKFISVYAGNNAIHNSHSDTSKFVSVFPQGWAFFTASSKGPLFYVFDCNSKYPKLKNLRSFSKEYYFGISRKNRVLNIEINNMFQQIEKDSINGIVIKTSDINNISHAMMKQKFIFNKIFLKKENAPNFKGKYFFVTQTLLPWSILRRKSDYPSLYNVFPIEICQK